MNIGAIRKKLLRTLPLPFVLLPVLVFSGCDRKRSDNWQTPSAENEKPAIESVINNDVSSVEDEGGPVASVNKPESEIKEIEVIVRQWAFEPSVIVVKKGERVKLKVKSLDVMHGFAIPAGFNIDKKLVPGETVEIEFVADEVGEFPFFCSIGCGEGHFDMNGKIIVTE